MRTITINGVSFCWKLTQRRAKEIGLTGPANEESLTAALTAFRSDFEASRKLVLAGCAEADRAKVEESIEDWAIPDDYVSFIEQALGPKQQASAVQ